MTKRVKKLLALMLIALMVFQFGGAAGVSANDNEVSSEEISNTTDEPIVSNLEPSEETELNRIGDLTLEELKTMILDDADIPEVISKEAIEEKGHVKRLYEQEEDLSTVVFQNKDGTKTMYLYNEPVKYKDKDGKIKDKSTTISEKKDDKNGNKYETTENDIKVIFPDSISDGLSLQYGELNIKLTPITEKEAKNIKKAEKAFSKIPSDVKENEKVKYSGVFGDKTEILYTPIFSGIKEDIVLNEYTGQSEFSFTLNTNGLTLCNENGYICLVDPLTGVEVASVGDIITYDSNDENSIGSIDIETVTGDNEYILTIIVDKKFLKDEKTVYPVYVDPTITIFSNGLGGDIQDTLLWNSYTGKPAGSNQNLYVGNYYARHGMASYGYLEKGRALLKFPGLYNNTTVRNLSNDQINSVKLAMYDAYSLSSSSKIYCYRMSKNWSESTSKCTVSLWEGYTGSSLDYKTVCTDNGPNYTFNITNAVKDWKDGYYGGLSGNYGVMLKQASPEDKKAVCFASAQNPTSNQRPSLIVDYDTNIVATQLYLNATNITLNVGETFQLVHSTNPSNADTNYMYVDDGPLFSVSDNGLITGVSPGTSTLYIYESISGLTTSCTVKVEADDVNLLDGVYFLRNATYGKYLDVQGGTVANGRNVQVYGFNGSAAQQWYFQKQTDGSYKIKSDINRNYVLDCHDNHYSNGTEVNLYSNKSTSDKNQRWWITENSDGTYTIRSALYYGYDQVLDATNGTGDAQLWEYVGVNTNQKWSLKRIYSPHITNVGISGDIYISCWHGGLNSSTFLDNIYDSMKSNLDPLKILDYSSENVNTFLYHGANKNNFLEMSNNTNFMIYCGHGIAADRTGLYPNPNDRTKGNFLHYNWDCIGIRHKSYETGCAGDQYNLYTSEAEFGAGTNSSLKWVLLYTCNFLNENDYVTNDNLKHMMQGAHIVLGYGTQCLLHPDIATNMGTQFGTGNFIIDSFFKTGDQSESLHADDNHIQRAMYVDSARYDTLYSTVNNVGTFETETIIILENGINDATIWS